MYRNSGVLWQSTLVLTKKRHFSCVQGAFNDATNHNCHKKNVGLLGSFVITSNLWCAKPIVCHFYDKFCSLTAAIDWGLACQYELEPISNFWVKQVLLIIKLTSDCVWPTLQQWDAPMYHQNKGIRRYSPCWLPVKSIFIICPQEKKQPFFHLLHHFCAGTFTRYWFV